MHGRQSWVSALALLAACAGQGDAPASGDAAVVGSTIRHIWSGAGADFLTNDISPDGRYLSDINWSTGDLRLIDLETGEAWDVTGRGYGAGRYAWTSSFSRDSRRMAVAWYDYETGAHELQVMDLDGGDSRLILPAGDESLYVDPLDWTPSDEEIVVALRGRNDTDWRIGVLPTDGAGDLRVLKTLGWLAPGGEQTYPTGEVSPDGRFVAYDYPPDLDERSRDIYAVALDGSGETTLVEHPAWDRLLGWLPDGAGILFYSDRGGEAGVWRQPVRDGRPSGEPELVRTGPEGLLPLGFAGGAYAYAVEVERPRVHTAVVDLEGGGVVAPPTPVEDPSSHSSLGMDWSPDGQMLAYARHDPPPDPVEVLVLRSMNGEVIRELPLPPALHTSLATVRWVSPDTVMLFGMGKGVPGIYQLDPRDGRFNRLPDPEGSAGRVKKFTVGPEGRLLYVDRPGEGGEREIVARVAGTGEQRVIGTAVALRALAVSPDGEELAMIARDPAGGSDVLRMMTTGVTPSTRTVHAAPPGHALTGPVAWTPDGGRLLFGTRDDRGPSLWSVSADGGGEPIWIGGGPEWVGLQDELRVHPDGRRLAFVAGAAHGEVWVLEGF